jgi:fucose permease
MDAGFNAAVALRGDGRLMALLHAGYGLGAAIGPLVMGATLAGGGGWRAAYAVFAAVSFLLVVPLLGKSLGEAPPQEHMGSPRGVVLVCLTFMLYVALEATVGQWAFTSLSRQHELSDFAAAAWVAVYWLGLTAGRVWLGVRGHRVEPRRLLVIATGGAVLGTGVLWLGGPISPAGLAVTGLALSVVFPLMMLLTPERIGAERAAAAVGWQTAAASVGAAVGPLVVGVILDRTGIEAYGPSVAVMAVLLLSAVRLLSGRRRPDGVPAT